jgi:hypothetical protein
MWKKGLKRHIDPRHGSHAGMSNFDHVAFFGIALDRLGGLAF